MNAEELRAKYGQENKMKLLDGIGHVFLVDTMGSDERIEQVARLSYKGGRKRSDTRGLLRYLLRHRHTRPVLVNPHGRRFVLSLYEVMASGALRVDPRSHRGHKWQLLAALQQLKPEEMTLALPYFLTALEARYTEQT